MNNIAFIYFDAAGTLLFPQPNVGEVYAAVGRRFGSRHDAIELLTRFRTAFQRQEALDATNGWRTSETRELARWRAIVADALDDTTDVDRCFDALYRHFARPDAWVCPPETADVLGELEIRGYSLGMASNFDQRLSTIIAGKEELQKIRHVQISAAAGWSKPAPEFYEAAARLAQTPPERILFIGDDPRNDYDGPRAAGFAAHLIDAQGHCERADVPRLTGLADLLPLLPPSGLLR